MLSRKCTLIFPDQYRRLFSDGPHFLGAIASHIKNRPDMQRTHRGVGVPGALSAVLRKDFGELRRVIGKVLKRDCTIFNKRDRLSISL